MNPFQLGTGSWDYTSALMYDIRLQNLGFNLVSNYSINTKNKSAYKYGNNLNAITQVY